MSEHAELVTLIRNSGSAETLLRQHTPDPSGRCPRCRAGNIQSGRVLGQCSIYAAAKAAQAQAERRGVWKPC